LLQAAAIPQLPLPLLLVWASLPCCCPLLLSARTIPLAASAQAADALKSCGRSCTSLGLTICVDTTQQVLVQAHLIEGLKRLLPLGEERLALTTAALGSAHAAQHKQAKHMAGV
jgi:hypothetical protein